MARRTRKACTSVWERRRLRWLAGLGVALVAVVVVGIGGASSVLAGAQCVPDVPSANTPPSISEARGVAGGTLTSQTRATWLNTICGAPTYTYGWQRSTDGGTTWSNI